MIRLGAPMLKDDDVKAIIAGLPASMSNDRPTVARGRRTLILLPEEEAMILGLTIHTELNNQEIQSIFSHVSRTVNHREFGFIRNKEGRYTKLKPASKTKVDEFLVQYSRLELEIRRRGFVPTARRDDLGILAQEAMIAAVAVFNNPSIKFKSEMFIVNICIAWTYLIHAYYLSQGIEIIYRDKNGDIVKTRHGNEKYIDLNGCLSHPDCPLDNLTKKNLEFLLEIRHEIEHRGSDNVDQFLAPKFQANCLNFDHYLKILLGKEFEIASRLPFSVQMNDFTYDKDARAKKELTLPKELVAVHRSFERNMTREEYNDPRYAYRIHILPRTSNGRGGADEVIQIARTEKEISNAAYVVLKDREKHKFLERQVLDYVHERGFNKFNTHHFRQFWKSIEAKKKGKGYGTLLNKQWFWYETIYAPVIEHCEEMGETYRG